MKASDYVARFLQRQGVPCVFEMSGGMITHLLDSISRTTSVRIVSVHHEQSAAFAAEAVGRLTGVPGVALATSGPGATNLITGIGSCYFDSSPAVFLTGQVNRHEQKGDRAIRQLGFQETDIVSMVRPVTKAAWAVRDPTELPALLRRAFRLATHGRPGPVLIDIPMDVQRAEVDPSEPAAPAESADPAALEPFLDELLGALAAAERPLLLAGGGLRSARAVEPFRRLAAALGVPVVHSLMGVDVLPFGDPLRVGMIGSYGNRWANMALGRCDALVVVGSRLDVRQTGSDTDGFKADKRIFHVDCEPGEMNNRVTGCAAHVAHLDTFLAAAAEHVRRRGRAARAPAAWERSIAEQRGQWPDDRELEGVAGINPNRFMHQLSAVSGAAAAFVVDVGQHQMWAAQSLRLGDGQRFLTSGGMGSMGFALPAAVGAAFAGPGRAVVVVAGDGGFQTNIQELETVRRNRLALKLVVINNQCQGMVRQFQESYFDGRYQSTLWGYSAPDFAAVARAYGIDAHTVADEQGVPAALGRLWADPSAPGLLQVMVDTYANAYPKMAFGRPITEMEPYAKPLDMEGT